MTTQASDQLLYRGDRYTMLSTPLEDYFQQVGTRPAFKLTSTGNWRGYIGEWEVEGGKLYLKDLLQMGLRSTGSGLLPCLETNQVALADIFPESVGRVFAAWFTGQVKCRVGKAPVPRTDTLKDVYERYLVLSITSGVVWDSAIEARLRSIHDVKKSPTITTSPKELSCLGRFDQWLKKFM